jgi:putative exosortase-associated protein (TIGR04073 family)
MRKLIFLFAVTATAVVITGCAGPEQKLSRGLGNTLEVVRWGDMRQSIEQNAVFSSPDISYTYGVVHGFDQSVKRIGLGVYEVITFPIPRYHPIFTNSVPSTPQYPDSFQPGLVSSTTFDTDTYTGFSGGSVLPIIPGSRFQIFDN